MKVTRGDIVEHKDGSIYVIEKVSSHTDDPLAQIGTIVETTPRFHHSILTSGLRRILAHTELDDEGEK